MIAATEASVSIQSALLIAGFGGLIGSVIGGWISLRATSKQLAAEFKRQWLDIAATAYATTFAVAGEFNSPNSYAIAQARHDSGIVPDFYAAIRNRASSALSDLERTSALSDNDAVQRKAERASSLLRQLDRAWTQLIGWRLATLSNAAGSPPYNSAMQLIGKLEENVDVLFVDIYGPGGEGGALEELRDAIRGSRA